jgi:hypothetical protein
MCWGRGSEWEEYPGVEDGWILDVICIGLAVDTERFWIYNIMIGCSCMVGMFDKVWVTICPGLY